jgi:NAD+ diphosphatase
MLHNRNPNTFANGPLDRSGHRRKDAAWLEAAAQDATSLVCAFLGDKPFVQETAKGFAAQWLAPQALALADRGAPTVFLGVEAGGAAVFAIDLPRGFELGGSVLEGLGDFTDLRMAAATLSDDDAATLGCAKALLDWHRRHRFCANCGAGSTALESGWKRVCSACGTEHFPRVDPVAIMLPVQGDRCLLGRQKRFPPGMYSALAGFVEPGETVEEAAAREVLEEVGLVATGARYVGAQPWPFPSQLMMGLIVEVEAGDTLLEDEISAVIWLTKQEAKAALTGGVDTPSGRVFAPPKLAIAHHLMQAWIAED